MEKTETKTVLVTTAEGLDEVMAAHRPEGWAFKGSEVKLTQDGGVAFAITLERGREAGDHAAPMLA